MSVEKEETLFFILFGIFLAGVIVLLIFIQCLEKDFKTDRQICEENGGVYIEDLSSHNQHQCMYGLKGK